MMRGVRHWAVAVREPVWSDDVQAHDVAAQDALADGVSGNGASVDGVSGNGALENGASGNGASANGTTDDRASANGTSAQTLQSGSDELGSIAVKRFPLTSWIKRHWVYRLPVIRGVVALVESLGIGLRALSISASAQLPEEDQEISGGAWFGTVLVSVVFAVGLFFVVPVGLTSLIKDQLGSSLLFWLVEGLLRTAIFLGYLVLLSRIPRSAPRVRVPRRRAQGDLVLRGRG